MYVELIGEMLYKGEDLIFVDPFERKAFQISGDDAKNLRKILPLCTGTIAVEKIAQILGMGEVMLLDLFRLLEQNKMVTLKETVDTKVVLVTNSLPSTTLETICNQEEIRTICQIKSLEQLSEEDSLIVAIDEDNNYDFFENIQRKSFFYKKPWLKVSWQDPYVFAGPLFFPDGGPCYTCCRTRIQHNSKVSAESGVLGSFGRIENVIAPFLIREILKFVKTNSRVTLFEREMVINLTKYEIDSYRVLRVPNCPECANKENPV